MKSYSKNTRSQRKAVHAPLKFQDMAKRINVYLKSDNENLDFNGYTETVVRFFRLDDHDFYEIFQTMTECNLWSNYLSDVQNYIQEKKLGLELEVDRLNAYFDKKVPDEIIEKEIQLAKSKSKEFLIFHKQVIAQQKFFERSYWHCYRLYGKAVNTMNYKNVN